MQKRNVEKVQQLLLMPNYDINYASQKKITPLILASKLGMMHTWFDVSLARLQ